MVFIILPGFLQNTIKIRKKPHKSTNITKNIHSYNIPLHYLKGNSVKFVWIPRHSKYFEEDMNDDGNSKLATSSTITVAKYI